MKSFARYRLEATEVILQSLSMADLPQNLDSTMQLSGVNMLQVWFVRLRLHAHSPSPLTPLPLGCCCKTDVTYLSS